MTLVCSLLFLLLIFKLYKYIIYIENSLRILLSGFRSMPTVNKPFNLHPSINDYCNGPVPKIKIDLLNIIHCLV